MPPGSRQQFSTPSAQGAFYPPTQEVAGIEKNGVKFRPRSRLTGALSESGDLCPVPDTIWANLWRGLELQQEIQL